MGVVNSMRKGLRLTTCEVFLEKVICREGSSIHSASVINQALVAYKITNRTYTRNVYVRFIIYKKSNSRT